MGYARWTARPLNCRAYRLYLHRRFQPGREDTGRRSPDQTIKLWDVRSGQLIRFFKGHGDSVYSVAFSPNGKTIASASHDRTIRLWDVNTGHLIRALEGHGSFVHAVAFSPDGNQIASGSYDETLGLWDVSSGRRIAPLTGIAVGSNPSPSALMGTARFGERRQNRQTLGSEYRKPHQLLWESYQQYLRRHGCQPGWKDNRFCRS